MQNYFTLLGLPEGFTLDPSDLERLYFEKQREFHPDRQHGKSPEERQRAALASAEANRAYQTLKNPLTRAQHLLALRGIQVNTDGRDTVKPSPELLMEMMTLREELAECQTPAQREKLEHYNKREWENALEKLAGIFAARDWHAAALLTLRLRYLEKFREELRIKVSL